MNQTLVVGSTVIDVLVSLSRLPKSGEDINISAQHYRLGGCAYNVFETLRVFKSPAFLASPAGTGIYGTMVREKMKERGIEPFVNLEEENGCCYCLVDGSGERSFLSHHGAEYLFMRQWMDGMDLSVFDSLYISGIDVEDRTGDEIVSFACENKGLDLYFAPGPRIAHIDPFRVTKILGRRGKNGKGPFLHLNSEEAFSLSGRSGVEEAAAALAGRTANSVVITLGEKGCYCYDFCQNASGCHIPGIPVRAIDTTGAGDAHFGAVIAGLKQGRSLAESCVTANKTGAMVAGTRGCILDKMPEE